MPRRKTKQPEPRERFEFDDIEIEVRDGDTWLIGRGLHKQKEWELKADKMLEKVFREYSRPHPFIKDRRILRSRPAEKDYMRSASAFAREMEQTDFVDRDATDDSSLRKKTYQHIKKHLTVMENAVKELKD